MLAREHDDGDPKALGAITLHAIVISEVETIVTALRTAGRIDPLLLEFLHGHVRRYLIALKVVHGDASAMPEHKAALAVLAAIGEMLHLPPTEEGGEKEAELVKRFLEAEDNELLALHLLQASEEIEALRGQVGDLRRAAGSALDAAKSEDARIERLQRERAELLEHATDVEDDVRDLKRRLADSESRAAREGKRAEEAEKKASAAQTSTERAMSDFGSQIDSLRKELAERSRDLAIARDDSARSRSLVAQLSEELAEAKLGPSEPAAVQPSPGDPREPADVAPMRRRMAELEAEGERLAGENAALASRLAPLQHQTQKLAAENAEMKKRMVAWQSNLPRLVNENAAQFLDQERKRIEHRIGELAGRDAALKGIEGAYVIVRGAGGVVVVPKQVAKYIGIGPGTPLRMQVDGATVRYSKV